MLNAIYDFFYFLCRPEFWLMLNRFDADWDRQLNELMDAGEEPEFSSHTIRMGGVSIWVENYPYGYANPWHPIILNIRPSKRTMMRLRRGQINYLNKEQV